MYAPMADVGQLIYDKDAVYVHIPRSKLAFSQIEDATGTAKV
jgi:hypothetical protein